MKNKKNLYRISNVYFLNVEESIKSKRRWQLQIVLKKGKKADNR